MACRQRITRINVDSLFIGYKLQKKIESDTVTFFQQIGRLWNVSIFYIKSFLFYEF